MGTEQQSMGASETELTGRCRRNVHIDDKASHSHRCLPRSRPVSRINRGRQTPNSGCSPESYWVPRPRPHSQCLPMVGSWQPLNHDSRPENDPRIRQESDIWAGEKPNLGRPYCRIWAVHVKRMWQMAPLLSGAIWCDCWVGSSAAGRVYLSLIDVEDTYGPGVVTEDRVGGKA